MTKSGELTYVFTTTDATAQGLCFCTLTQGGDGLIYGTAVGGGASGTTGTEVLIWGSNLLQSTVQFNGVAATDVRNGGPQYVLATVPASATPGPITVVTKGGVSTTQQSFQVE